MRYAFIIIIISTCFNIAFTQVSKFPFTENFDNSLVPKLPHGWGTTFQRSATGDFVTVQSSAHSDSTAVVSTNAKVQQCLFSPILDFSGLQAESLTFYERRSASHNSDIIVEASTDGGAQYLLPISDTLRNPNTTSYIYRACKFPDGISGNSDVMIRWRVIGNGNGTTGTVRFDDISFSALYGIDVSIYRMEIDPQLPVFGEDIAIRAIIKNAGAVKISDVLIQIFMDINANSFPEQSELISDILVSEIINKGEAFSTESKLTRPSAGLHPIIITCHHPEDANTSNDTGKFFIDIGYPLKSIVINEIMYDPLSNGAEYVEIFNPGEERIDIAGWKLSDERDLGTISLKHIISETVEYLDKNRFLIVAGDSSVFNRFQHLRDTSAIVFIRPNNFNLGNNGDVIILSDRYNRSIDSVCYRSEWHNPYLDDCSGRSLERVNPGYGSNDKNNWRTSANIDGGTPGAPNSIYTISIPNATKLSSSPNPFSPDADGYEDLTIIQYHINANAALIRLRIFDSHGRLIRILADGDPAGSHGECMWDGFNEKRQRVQIGLYIILLEILNENKTTLESVKSVVAVAGKL